MCYPDNRERREINRYRVRTKAALQLPHGRAVHTACTQDTPVASSDLVTRPSWRLT